MDRQPWTPRWPRDRTPHFDSITPFGSPSEPLEVSFLKNPSPYSICTPKRTLHTFGSSVLPNRTQIQSIGNSYTGDVTTVLRVRFTGTVNSVSNVYSGYRLWQWVVPGRSIIMKVIDWTVGVSVYNWGTVPSQGVFLVDRWTSVWLKWP